MGHFSCFTKICCCYFYLFIFNAWQPLCLAASQISLSKGGLRLRSLSCHSAAADNTSLSASGFCMLHLNTYLCPLSNTMLLRGCWKGVVKTVHHQRILPPNYSSVLPSTLKAQLPFTDSMCDRGISSLGNCVVKQAHW